MLLIAYLFLIFEINKNMDDWLGSSEELEIGDIRSNRIDKVRTAFSGLESAMNLPEGSTPIPKGLAKTVKKATEVAVQTAKEVLADPEESFEDKEFIRETIKVQIIKMQSTLEIMEGSIMVGAEPRLFEVYSDLNKSVLDACTKLMQLQRQSENAKMMKAAPTPNEVTITETKSIKANGGDMASLLEKLRGGDAT
jgi:hypothetical protein